MGVPRFYRWLIDYYDDGQVLVENLPGNISTLSIDMNALFYPIANTVYGYGNDNTDERISTINNYTSQQLFNEFMAYLFTKMESLISQIHPQDGLILAVDGVPTQAKIVQQRGRRYRGPKTMDIEEKKRLTTNKIATITSMGCQIYMYGEKIFKQLNQT